MGIDHIRTALTDLGEERLDHGTNIVEDPRLADLVVRNSIGLTCRPVSNSFVTADMKAREMVDLLRRGAKITVNSDDPAYFRAYVADNYLALAKKARLERAGLVRIARNSFDVAWTDEGERQRYQAELNAYAKSNA